MARDDVLADHVAFEVHAVAGPQVPERRGAERKRDDLHVEPVSPRPATVRLTPSTATDPLRMKNGASGRRKPDRHPVAVAVPPDLLDDADAVHVPENEVAAEPAVQASSGARG